MELIGEHTIAGTDEMCVFAKNVLELLHGGDVLLLIGDLGSGKTTFVQCLARSLGISDRVTSPTYTLVHDYSVNGHDSIATLVHADLYRLNTSGADGDPAVREVVDSAGQSQQLTVVEWADRLSPARTVNAWKMYFSHGSKPNERVVRVESGTL